MNYTGLTDERDGWLKHLVSGGLLDIYVLQQYRLNRNSNLWRSTREVEKLCEYLLFLEGASPMSESYIVRCDQCQADISLVTPQESYRIRVMEEDRQIGDVQPSGDRELSRFMNFCNLEHLKEWLEQR